MTEVTPKNESTDVQIAIIMTEMANIKISMGEIKSLIINQENRFVTKEEFGPFKWLIGIVITLLVTATVGGVLSLVWTG